MTSFLPLSWLNSKLPYHFALSQLLPSQTPASDCLRTGFLSKQLTVLQACGSLPISRFCSKTPFPPSLPGLFSPSQGQWHSERRPQSSGGSGRREETGVSGTQQYAVWTLPHQGLPSPCGYPSFSPLKSQAWIPCVGLDRRKQLSPLFPHPKGGRLNRGGRGTPPKDPAALCPAVVSEHCWRQSCPWAAGSLSFTIS